jgi:type IV secretory pathway ATPase VirB11/archaellum biosynthesis ATPase
MRRYRTKIKSNVAKDKEIKQKDRERQLAKRSVEKSRREKELAREKERIRKAKQRAKTGSGSESGSKQNPRSLVKAALRRQQCRLIVKLTNKKKRHLLPRQSPLFHSCHTLHQHRNHNSN